MLDFLKLCLENMADERPHKKPLKNQPDLNSGGALSPLERYLSKQKQEKAALAAKVAPPKPVRASLGQASQKAPTPAAAPASLKQNKPSVERESSERPSLSNIQRPAPTEPDQPASLGRWESVAESRFNETEPHARESVAPARPSAPDVDFIKPMTDASLTPDGLQNADFGPRLIAWLIDGCILLFISYFAEKIALALLAVAFGSVIDAHRDGLSAAVKLCVIYAYYGYFYPVKGASPGKMMLGLEVLDTDGVTRLTPWKAFFREAIGKTISFIPFAMGYVIVLIRADHRALHDLLFDTRVIRKSESGKSCKTQSQSLP
jgi:uncharacterized RDD family membrane protein YckC